MFFKKKNNKETTEKSNESKDLSISSSIKSEAADQIFTQKRLLKENKRLNQFKGKLFFLAYILVTLVILIVYACLPISKLNYVHIVGNHYLSNTYASQLIADATSNYALLNVGPVIEYQLRKNPWIANVSVTLTHDLGLDIIIEEKQPVGYIYENDQAKVVFSDTSMTALNSYTTDVISMIPYIHGFQESQYNTVAKALADIDQQTIESIAEVEALESTYQTDSMIITMADGNYFIGSRFSMVNINRYNDIASYLQGSGHCIYTTDNDNVVYTSSCPWIEQEKVEVVDYFLDCDGNPILDEAGNPIQIQYLTDASGNYIYDSKGLKTIINQIEMPNCELEAETEEQSQDQPSTNIGNSVEE